jgi:TatD DNase family protein
VRSGWIITAIEHLAPLQVKVLEAQLELASQLGLPVILHNREASQDLISILRTWQFTNQKSGLPLADRPGVLHSFTSDATTAHEAIKMNFSIGITGPVTYPNAKNLQLLAAELPLAHVLLETDAPFLPPQPKRGKRNEPAFLFFTAEKFAELQGRAIEEIAQITTANARMLFQIGEKTLA